MSYLCCASQYTSSDSNCQENWFDWERSFDVYKQYGDNFNAVLRPQHYHWTVLGNKYKLEIQVTQQAHNVKKLYLVKFRWLKFNVNTTSNVNLMSNTEISWLCNQNPTLSQRHIAIKSTQFHSQPKCNVDPTSTWYYIDVLCLLDLVFVVYYISKCS